MGTRLAGCVHGMGTRLAGGVHGRGTRLAGGVHGMGTRLAGGVHGMGTRLATGPLPSGQQQELLSSILRLLKYSAGDVTCVHNKKSCSRG